MWNVRNHGTRAHVLRNAKTWTALRHIFFRRAEPVVNCGSSKNDKMAKLVSNLTGLLQNTIKAATPQARIIQRYALVEMVPPTPKDLPAIRAGIGKLLSSAKTGAYKNLTVKEAWLNTLVAVEIWCWFFVGECIGKRHLVGYDV